MQNRLGLPHIYDSRHRDRLFLPALQQVVLDLKVTKGDNLRVLRKIMTRKWVVVFSSNSTVNLIFA